MIKYSLKCNKDHVFEALFSVSSSFEKQNKKKLISCPSCGSLRIEKSIMAPNISPKGQSSKESIQKKDNVEVLLNKARKNIEANFDYVGDKFADEARSMHYGEKDEREIYGETTIEDAVELIEEGINVHPVPGINPKLKN